MLRTHQIRVRGNAVFGRYYAVFGESVSFPCLRQSNRFLLEVPWLGSLLVMFLRARRWPVGPCVFHIQPAKRTLRMSTFVLPVAGYCPPHVRQDGLARTVYRVRRASDAWTSPLLPPGVPSVMSSVIRVGKNRAKLRSPYQQL